eukprot:10269216-Alexandrium_andersonii.AAC.1
MRALPPGQQSHPLRDCTLLVAPCSGQPPDAAERELPLFGPFCLEVRPLRGRAGVEAPSHEAESLLVDSDARDLVGYNCGAERERLHRMELHASHLCEALRVGV